MNVNRHIFSLRSANVLGAKRGMWVPAETALHATGFCRMHRFRERARELCGSLQSRKTKSLVQAKQWKSMAAHAGERVGRTKEVQGGPRG